MGFLLYGRFGLARVQSRNFRTFITSSLVGFSFSKLNIRRTSYE